MHVELATKTKLFSASPNRFGDEPNTNIDPVTLGLPGALPVLNRRAVSLRCASGLRLIVEFRSQRLPARLLLTPTCRRRIRSVNMKSRSPPTDGLTCPMDFRVGIERGHLEEDTGKSTHCWWRWRTDSRLGLLAHRLQPCRRSPSRNRQSPRHPSPRSGQGLRNRASVRSLWRLARPTRKWRRVPCASMPT